LDRSADESVTITYSDTVIPSSIKYVI